MGALRQILSAGLALFLIALFLHVTVHPWPNPVEGAVQLFDRPGTNIIFGTLAATSGQPLFEPAGRVLVAGLELVAAGLLILPWTRKLGAFLAFFILAGAVCLHLSPLLGQELPLSLGPGETGTDNGGTFSLAVAMLVASILILVVHPARRRGD